MNNTNTDKENKNSQFPLHSWRGKIACQYMDKHLKRDNSQMKTALNSFVYGHLLKGQARINYNNISFTVSAGDQIVLAPFSPTVIEEVSDDLEGLCLMVSSEFAYESHDTRNLLQTLIITMNQPHNPVIKLTDEEAKLLEEILRMLIYHIEHSNNYTYDALQSLYGLYLANLMNIIDKRGLSNFACLRSYKLFMDFNFLLNKHFRNHHDITFYADQLGISPRYLSMVTKEVSHTTVATFINRKIMLEACWLLKTTDYSISKISELLHFSDQASFSKFFKRVNGVPPLQFRRK